jgi:PAS domain S-box-containing protein
MNLQRKTLSIVGLTLACMVVLLYFVLSTIIMDDFQKVEADGVQKDAERLIAVFEAEMADLDSLLFDWSAWDDTYVFIADGNEEYIKSNLIDGTFDTLQLNLILFLDSSGEIVSGKSYDLEEMEEIPISSGLDEHIYSGAPLLRHYETYSNLNGIIVLPEGPMFIASRPILTSNDEGPIRGTMIFGRYLSSSEMDRIADLTQLSITGQDVDEELPQDFQEAFSLLSTSSAPNSVVVEAQGPDSICGYTLFRDIYGEPALILRVDTTRPIYMKALASLRYLVYTLAIFSLIFGLLFYLLLNRFVIFPLAFVNAAVNKIGANGDLTSRISFKGDDELSSLTDAINKMLDDVEKSQYDKTMSEKKYRELADLLPQTVFEMDARGNLLFANQFAFDAFGYSRQDFAEGLNVLQMVSSEQWDEIKENIQKAMSGDASGFEYQMLRKDGSTFPAIVHSAPVVRDGRVVGLRGIVVDISELKLMEADLRESEERYRAIFENTGTAMVIIDENTVVSLANSESEELTGYSRKEMVGKVSWTELVPKDKLKLMKQYHDMRRKDPSAAPRTYESNLINANGDTRDVVLSVTSIPGTNKTVASILDITEKKRAESRLQKMNQCFLNFGPDPMMNIGSLTALCGAIMGADCALYSCLEGGQLVYLGQWNVPSDFKTVDRTEGHICSDVIENGTNQPFIVNNLPQTSYANTDPNVCKYGLQTYIGFPVKLGGSNVGSLCAIYNNVHEPGEEELNFLSILASAMAVEEARRRAETELRKRDHLLAAATSVSNNLLIEKDFEEAIHQVVEMLGPATDVDRAYIFENVDLESGNSYLDQGCVWAEDTINPHAENFLENTQFSRWHETLSSGDPIIGLVRDFPPAERSYLESKDILSILAMPIIVDGQFWGFIAFDDCHSERIWSRSEVSILEVTSASIAGAITRKIGEDDLRRAHDELDDRVKERTAELEAKTAEMEQFVYTVSHDLRSPLFTLRGFVGFLRKDIDEGVSGRGIDEGIRENLETDFKMIEDAVKIMDRLLSDTLDLSRIGRVVSPPEDVSFLEIVQEALDQTSEKIRIGGVKVSAAKDWPVVHVDRSRMVEVLVNLIENSIRYMGDQEDPQIELGSREEDDETIFFVRDNGIGIDPSQHEKVFGLFYQIDPDIGVGTGVGLSIIKRIIEVHGGRIWIESEAEKGCTVCFTLGSE